MAERKPKKKKDIDYSKIFAMYIDTIWSIRQSYRLESVGRMTLSTLQRAKADFMRLKDKYEFNEVNEKLFNEKTAKLFDFEKQLIKDSNELNQMILDKMEENDKNFFSSDEPL